MTRAKILFVVNNAAFFLSHRLPLGLAAKSAGYDVHVATPEGPAVNDVRAHGFTFHPIAMTRSSGRPVSELRTIAALHRLYRELRPSIVHHVTIKPILYGGLASRLARVPATANAVSGLGYVFLAKGLRASAIRAAARAAYRIAFGHPNSVAIFQNEEDRAMLFGDAKLRSVLIRGSGVDVEVFHPPSASEDDARGPLVVLPARMLWDKGVREFVAAARELQREGVRARFVLVGDTDEGNPAAVPASQLRMWQREGVVAWWGFRTDMAEVLRSAELVCLPSYREGLPKVLLEAAASGRAIVTSDAPGCRDVVRDRDNGLLVPVRNERALAVALRALITNPDERARMGVRGRARAVAEFSVDRVIDETLALYNDLLDRSALREARENPPSETRSRRGISLNARVGSGY